MIADCNILVSYSLCDSGASAAQSREQKSSVEAVSGLVERVAALKS